MSWPIFIPTCGRADCQITLAYLQQSELQPVLVVRPDEYDEYRDHHPDVIYDVLPSNYEPSYTYVANFIRRRAQTPFFWMIDDDIFKFRAWIDDVSLEEVPFTYVMGAVESTMEEFRNRYANRIGWVGFNYGQFLSYGKNKRSWMPNRMTFNVGLFNSDPQFMYDPKSPLRSDSRLRLSMMKAGFASIKMNNIGHDIKPKEEPGGLHSVYAEMRPEQFAERNRQDFPEFYYPSRRFNWRYAESLLCPIS